MRERERERDRVNVWRERRYIDSGGNIIGMWLYRKIFSPNIIILLTLIVDVKVNRLDK